MARAYIGTSGWHYDHWKGNFYPEHLPAEKMLDFYKGTFRTAEINNTFYGLPTAKTVTKWYEDVPDDFIFSVKGSRYITHMKKLKDPEKPLSVMFERIKPLKGKLGPVLFQFPPGWKPDLGRLKEFLAKLPKKVRYTFELRDPSWFGPETEKLLSSANAAFCIYDLNGRQSPCPVTADFVYIRLHGPDGAYKGRYIGKLLNDWAWTIRRWLKEDLDVYCYFDNDQEGNAVRDAIKLRELLGDE